jgi:hypothetical protein
MKALMTQNNLGDMLEREVYAAPALVPLVPWLDTDPPEKPQLTVSGNAASWEAGNAEKVWLWVLQVRNDNEWTTRILPGPTKSRPLQRSELDVVAVTAIDRCGNASVPAVVQRSLGLAHY